MNRTEHLIKSSQSGDKTATETLMTENSGLIWSIVRRFQGRGVETDDLYQLGCLGFLKAIEGFDTSYGTQFSTYAVPKIAGEIRRFLRDDGTVKVSRNIKEQAVTIKTARNHLSTALGREPSISEISAHTGFSVDEIVLADAFSLVTVTVYNADGSVYGYGADSVESYAARVSNDLNAAIMKFASSARIYLQK